MEQFWAVVAALFAYFVASLSSGDFLDWGWRYPFFAAFAINVVALFARLRLVVTHEYEKRMEEHELDPAHLHELLPAQGHQQSYAERLAREVMAKM